MTEMMVPIHEKVHADVINPEIPERPKDKLELLNRCLGAKAYGRVVEGVTPHHIGSDGMYLLNRQPNLLKEPRGPQF